MFFVEPQQKSSEASDKNANLSDGLHISMLEAIEDFNEWDGYLRSTDTTGACKGRENCEK